MVRDGLWTRLTVPVTNSLLCSRHKFNQKMVHYPITGLGLRHLQAHLCLSSWHPYTQGTQLGGYCQQFSLSNLLRAFHLFRRKFSCVWSKHLKLECLCYRVCMCLIWGGACPRLVRHTSHTFHIPPETQDSLLCLQVDLLLVPCPIECVNIAVSHPIAV